MSEKHFQAALGHAHNESVYILMNSQLLQKFISFHESIDSNDAKVLAQLYLTVRRNVWDFQRNAMPLGTIFHELAGGLLSSFTDISPIEEQRQVYRLGEHVIGAVWVALDLKELCPPPPSFPLMTQTEEAIRSWQDANAEWCKKGEPLSDPIWLASRFQERYATVREIIMSIQMIDVNGVMSQLNRGRDDAAIRWLHLAAARKALAPLQNPGPPTAPPDEFTELLTLARNVPLRGKELGVVEALCGSKGALTIADLALKKGVNWENPIQGFKDVQRRLRPKLKRLGWDLIRQSNAANLIRLKKGKRS